MDKLGGQPTVPPQPDVNNFDTPRTQNLKFLRLKRLAFFSREKDNSSPVMNDRQESPTTDDNTTVKSVETTMEKRETPNLSTLQKIKNEQDNIFPETPKPLFTGEKDTTSLAMKKRQRSLATDDNATMKSTETTMEQRETPKLSELQQINNEQDHIIPEVPKPYLSEQNQEAILMEPETNRSLSRRSFVSDLDDGLLEDMDIPETQKLKHVMGWAEKFLKKRSSDDPMQESKAVFDYDELRPIGDVSRTPGTGKDTKGLQPAMSEWMHKNSNDCNAYNNCNTYYMDMNQNTKQRGVTFSSSKDTSLITERSSKSDIKQVDWKERPILYDTRSVADSEEHFMHVGGGHIFDNSRGNHSREEMLFGPSNTLLQAKSSCKAEKTLDKATLGSPDLTYFWVPLDDSSDEEFVPRIRRKENLSKNDRENINLYGQSHSSLSPNRNHVSDLCSSFPERDDSYITETISSKRKDWSLEEEWIMGNIHKSVPTDYASLHMGRYPFEDKLTNDRPKKEKYGSSFLVEDYSKLEVMHDHAHDFKKFGSWTGQRNKPSPRCGDMTDRTYIVNHMQPARGGVSTLDFEKYADCTNCSKREQKVSASAICRKETIVSSGNSALRMEVKSPEDPSDKVCPICARTNYLNTNWCFECESVLVGIGPKPAKDPRKDMTKGILKIMPDEKILPIAGIECTDSSEETSEDILSPTQEIQNHQKLYWDDSSEISSDREASALDKYYFYMNRLNKSHMQEPMARNGFFRLSTENNSENRLLKTSCEKSSTEKDWTIESDISDCRDSKVHFYGTTNIAQCDSPHPRKTVDNVEMLLADFDTNSKVPKATKGNNPIDSKLPKTKDIKLTVTVPRRYWEKSSIAWSSYTHGELKSRSQVPQRPLSADAVKRGAKDVSVAGPLMGGGTYNSKMTGTHPGQRPRSAAHSGTASLNANNKKNMAEAHRRSVHTWTVPQTQHPFQGSLQDAKEALNVKTDGDHGLQSMWLFLPDELWIGVFAWLSHRDLSQTAQACRRFCQLIADDILWKNIQLQNCHSLNDDWLISIGLRHPKSFCLSHCHDETQRITDRGLDEFFHNCKETLKELKITSCSGPSLKGDSVLLHASKYCTHLTQVDISWSGATDIGVIALAECTTSLQGLSVNGCKVTDDAMKVLIKKHCKSLCKLEVFGCHALTPKCLYSIASDCIHLQTLNIGRVPKVTNGCLTGIVTNLKKLTALNVTGLNVVRDRVVHQVVKQCPKMESLTISSCSQVTDVSLVEISTYLPTIRYLDVSGCKKVTDAGVQALARSCQQLSYLDLSSTGIGKRGVCLLASYCHRTLESLKLSFCKEITADAVEKLCQNCKRLKMLHLYGCHIGPDLQSLKQINKAVQWYHDLSIRAWNDNGE